MAKKKMNPILLITLIVIALLSLNQLSRQGVIVDTMPIYDEFNTGVDYNKWNYLTYTLEECRMDSYSYSNQDIPSELIQPVVTDGELHILSSTRLDNFCPRRAIGWEVNSKKDFSSDDIKMYVYETVPEYCRSSPAKPEYYPHIYYGGIELNLPRNKDDACWIVGRGPTERHYFDGLLEIKHYDDLDINKFVVFFNGLEIQSGRLSDGPADLKFTGSMSIKYVRYEPYYSCEIDYNTEVVVRDTFGEGSQVNINNLKYRPTKLCPKDLGTLIFSDQGFTDEKGSITQALAEGETLTVPAGQYWQIDTVTKYVNDMKERCGLGQVYDTKLGVCTQQAYQQIENEVLLYCETDSDCILPSKCNDATVQCISNQCDYQSAICTPDQIINYIEVEKTLELAKPVINELNNGEYQITFNGEKSILGYMFNNNKPTPLTNIPGCRVDYNHYLDADGCYKVSIDWAGYNFDMTEPSQIDLNNNLNVSYDFIGKGVYYGVRGENEYNYEFREDGDSINKFVVTIKDIIDITDIDYKVNYLLNSNADVSLTLYNNIFDLNDVELNIEVWKDYRGVPLLDNKIISSLKSGATTTEFILPTDELGVYTVIITPKVKIADNLYYTKQAISFGYYVSEEGVVSTIPDSGKCKKDIDCSFAGQSATCNKDTGICIITETFVEQVGVGNIFLVVLGVSVFWIVVSILLKRRK